MDVQKRLIAALVIGSAVICFLPSCDGDDDRNGKDTLGTKDTITDVSRISIKSPQSLQSFNLSDSFPLEYEFLEKIEMDSVVITLGKKEVYNGPELNKIWIKTEDGRAGKNQIVVKIYYAGTMASGSRAVVLKPVVKPQNYTYKKIKTYKHDHRAYTQGLVYEDGCIYEGTGQNGESTLRKYKLETGELLQSYNLPDEDFGEGIVIWKDKIFQLTWQSGVAYEYEKSTFKLINRFGFNTEGWGLTAWNEYLVMSDGSNTLYFLDPSSFNEVDRLEVYDHVGPVNQLNELEVIDGMIYANIYTTDYIAIIDPATGVVTGKINMTGLLDESKISGQIDVLNGIAWDAKLRRLFVTGKWWPEMYEVSIVKQ